MYNQSQFTNIVPVQYGDGTQNRPLFDPMSHLRGGINDNRVNRLMEPARNADMQHTNMIPFFSGKQVNQPGLNAGTSRFTELFTAQGPDEFFPVRNKETKRFSDTFRQPVYGQPQQDRDRELEHINSSTLQNNHVPWERQYVSHGLNEGFTNRGEDVLHPTWRPKLPTVDQLRTKTNPKTSLEGRVVPGKAINENRTALPVVRKNRPFRDYANHPDRYLVTGGEEKKQMAHSKFAMKDSNRGLGEEPSNGPAGTQGYGKRPFYPEEKPARVTKRQTTQERPINAGFWALDSGFLLTNYTDYKTKRQVHHVKDYRGIAGTPGYEKLPSREAASNMRNNANKEPTMVRRFPTFLGGFNLPAGKDYQNYNSRKLNLSVRNTIPVHEMVSDKTFAQDSRPIGKAYTRNRNYYAEPRKPYDSVLVDMLHDNPYSLMLHENKEW